MKGSDIPRFSAKDVKVAIVVDMPFGAVENVCAGGEIVFDVDDVNHVVLLVVVVVVQQAGADRPPGCTPAGDRGFRRRRR
ncbi:hypothetical protein [Rhodococcus sp. IEGM 1318]|uniref:hypothetical protein n=1 Tax=Rhodococcus sp. IEGM 1318 TaxID=3082226 RepID=UPI0029529A3D|nr:hypothetical protein [Rhodococcus sp. IEGM 1318]MDV8005046.1 hypothetical protein [Rhodococcus sp. IEGM 1318]